MILSKKELLEVEGGKGITLYGIVATVLVFMIGLADGYLRPLACNL